MTDAASQRRPASPRRPATAADPPLPREARWEPRPFRPSAWARGPHAQTLLARILRPDAGPEMTRERLETPDGDFLDVDWGPDPGPGAPVALILHGLEGSSRRRYVRSVARELAGHGVWPVAMNFRGCSGEPNRALGFYHSGDTRDAGWILEVIARRWPERSRGAVGFSLGGNVLLKLLGERSDGGHSLLDAAAVMSVPYDLGAGCDLLEESLMGRLYSAYFLRSLRQKLSWKEARLAESIDLDAARSASTIRAFDDHVTAPLNGFRDATDYYARSSSRSFLASIRVPTLLLHAVDDPFLPAFAIPREQAAANPHVRLRLETSGGHVGFVEGSPLRPRFWGEETLAAFLSTLLSGRSAASESSPTGGPPAG